MTLLTGLRGRVGMAFSERPAAHKSLPFAALAVAAKTR